MQRQERGRTVRVYREREEKEQCTIQGLREKRIQWGDPDIEKTDSRLEL